MMSENICYNINIIRGRKLVCNWGWLANDILFIRQLTNPNGSFFSFEEFSYQFPHVQTNFLVYEDIIASIREYKVRTNIQLTADYEITDVKVWARIQTGNKSVQSTLAKAEVIPVAVKKWNGKSDVQLQ